MELLHVYGIVNSDKELKELLTDNFVVIFLDDKEISDNIIFEPVKYITLCNYGDGFIRTVIDDPYFDMGIREIIDELDKQEDFDLENFGERHEVAIDLDYPLYFYAIYKGNREDFENIITSIKKNGKQIISVKIIKYTEETIA